MKIHSFSVMCAASLFVGCVPLQPKTVTYQLRNNYQSAKSKIADYHQRQERKFTIFQDRMTPSISEGPSGDSCQFSLTRWAPDIGTHCYHRSTLQSTADGCNYTISGESSMSMEFAHTALRGKTLGPLQEIDTWVQKSLEVAQRTVTVNR